MNTIVKAGHRPAGRLARVGAALLLCFAAAVASAAEREDAIARALAHVAAFPQQTLNGPGQSFAATDVVIDADGSAHVRVERRFKGMRVIGGDMVVHTARNGGFASASRTLARVPEVDDRARIAPAEATRAALAGRAGFQAEGVPERVVYARSEPVRLAFDVRVFGTRDDGTPSELHVIVDAQRGDVLDSWDDVHIASNRGGGGSGGGTTTRCGDGSAGLGCGFFDGQVPLSTRSVATGYELRDNSRGGQYTIDMKNGIIGGTLFVDADNNWGDGTLTSRQSVGVDAQYGTAVTWDYFLIVHGRNGITGAGVGAYNRVHYRKRYNNAFWSDSCFCMTYGDGDGTTFNPFASLDVAGHEMTHGVTSRTANLIYSGESGGLNEATSDIFGTMVEYFAGNPNDAPDYYIGERLFVDGVRALRSMIQPSLDGVSSDCYYPGVGSLDVHYSSGVANHFYYLLAEGTAAGNPSKTCAPGDTRVATGAAALTGTGKDKAARIWYRALTVYMTSATDYAGARVATLAAATDLFGAGSTEAVAVAAAWSAVGRD